jgi:putative transposase
MAGRKPPVIADRLLDQLLGGADAKSAFEKDGLLDALKKALAERAFECRDRSSPGGWRGGRSSQQPQWVWQENGATGTIPLDVPRDRLSSATDRQGSAPVPGF